MIYLVLYIASVVAANVVTANTVPLEVTIAGTLFIITWGTWFIGFTFFLRDAVQVRYGRTVAYQAIAAALAFSLLFSIFNGDVFWIVVASGLAFGLSEALDTEIFTRYRTTLARRVLISGIFGGLVDSTLFVVVGLSPLTTGIIPWDAVPAAILGQWVVKSALQLSRRGVSMLALLTKSLPEIKRLRADDYDVGRLYTPRHYNSLRITNEAGIPWAADNDGYNGVDERAWLQMMWSLEPDESCLFVVIPDVLQDARATLEQFMRWHEYVSSQGFPVAYVLQDGLEGVGVPWDLCQAVFIGGSTRFKLGEHVRGVVQRAKDRGKWVHMGRVNSVRRIQYASAIGCDSIDGTTWVRFTDRYKHQLRALDHRQGTLT